MVNMHVLSQLLCVCMSVHPSADLLRMRDDVILPW